MKKILLALFLVPLLAFGQTVQFKSSNVAITGGTITGTTISGNTISTGTGTLALGAGKTINLSNSLTFTGTDSSSVAFGAGGTVLYTTGNSIGLANIAQIATNTILGNSTSGTANISAMAIGGCSSSSSALIWTTNTGFGCNTAIAASSATTATTATNIAGGAAGSIPYQTGSGATTTLAIGSAGAIMVSSGSAPAWLPTTTTGTGSVVYNDTPTLVTPVLGAATATSVNKVAFTAPTTAATFAFGTDNTTQTFQGTDTIVGRATTDTLTNKTLTNPTITNYVETAYVPSAGSSFTVSLANGTLQTLTTNANVTITLPTPVAGKSFTIMVAYGGTHTVTWAGGGTIKWAGGAAPTATSVNGKYDVYSFFSVDGTNTFGSDAGRNY